MGIYRIINIASLILRLIGLPVETDLLLLFGVQRPHSRATESEADHIGLLLMARACYDPRKSVELWKRMQELEKKRGMDNVLFKYVSTHPLGSTRIKQLQEWMSDAVKETSHCTKLRSALSSQIDFTSTLPTQNIQQQHAPIHRSNEKYEEEVEDNYTHIFGREERTNSNDDDNDW